MKLNLTILFQIIFGLSFQSILFSQSHTQSVAQKVLVSDVIITGEVINRISFINDDGYIYTKNFIKPNLLLLGNTSDIEDFIIISKGGEFEGKVESWTHQQNFDTNDYGIFFLKDASGRFRLPNKNVYHSEIGFTKTKSKYVDRLNGHQISINSTLIQDIITITEAPPLKNYSVDSTENEENCLNFNLVPFNRSDQRVGNLEINYSLFAFMENTPTYLNELEFILDYDNSILGDNIIQSGVIGVSLSENLAENDRYSLLLEDLTPNSCLVKIETSGINPFLIDLFEKEVIELSLNLTNIESALAIFQSFQSMDIQANLSKTRGGANFNQDCILIETETSSVCTLSITDVYIENEDGVDLPDVAAGVEDESLNDVPSIIIIEGEGFGFPLGTAVKPFFNDVYFYDVDNNSSDPYNQQNINNFFPAAELEYISWTDTRIEMRVPSMSKDGAQYQVPCAATGNIAVSTISCSTNETCVEFSPVDIVVHFGMFNDSWSKEVVWNPCPSTPAFEKFIRGGKRRNLVSRELISGGYNLFIEQLYSNSSDNDKALDQIEKALNVWRCNYKINVNIVNDINLADGVIKPGFLAGCESPIPSAGLVVMNTPSDSDNCNELGNEDSSILSFEIIINQDLINGNCEYPNPSDPSNPIMYQFNLDDNSPSDASATKVYFDMQRIMIHELGHAFQLRHTANIPDIMGGSLVNPIANNFRRSLSSNDILGAKHVQLLKGRGACPDLPMTDYVCSTTSISNFNFDLNLEIYPNPTTHVISLQSNELLSKVELFTSTGTLIKVFNFDGLSTKQDIELGYQLSNALYLLKVYNHEEVSNTVKIQVVK